MNDLLDDAIRAYVCSAPAAAIALCRSCVEVLLKKHYLPNDHKRVSKKDGKAIDKSLSCLIDLAEKRYACWKQAGMGRRIDHVNDLLHDYSRIRRLDPKDDQFVRDYLIALKTLIEAAPSTA